MNFGLQNDAIQTLQNARFDGLMRFTQTVQTGRFDGLMQGSIDGCIVCSLYNDFYTPAYTYQGHRQSLH